MTNLKSRYGAKSEMFLGKYKGGCRNEDVCFLN